MKTIPLNRGMFAIVDDGDFEMLNQFNWSVYEQKHVHGPSTFYAQCRSGEKVLLMHRVILGLIPGDKMDVDHINHDGLDNLRDNLRVVTHAQNLANQKSNRGTSRFKGVCWHKGVGKWVAKINKDGKRTHLGYYPTEEIAARAYDEKALAQWGEYALLNFSADDLEPEESVQIRRELRRNPCGGSSRFKGVSWNKRGGNWRARIREDGKQIFLGYYDSEEMAARAYEGAALQGVSRIVK